MKHIAIMPTLANSPVKMQAPTGTMALGERVHDSAGDLLLRPIRRDDVAALQRGFARLSAEEVRFRFLHPITDLPGDMARALCEPDPLCGVALVLIDPPPACAPEIHAVARAHVDAATLCAEFALIVQQRFTRRGLGSLLMQRLIAACRTRGAVEIWGDVLVENGAMLELCEHLGFTRRTQWSDRGIMRVILPLLP